MTYKIVFGIVVVISLCVFLTGALITDESQSIIRREIELLKNNRGQYDSTFTSFSSNVIPTYYEKLGYKTAWTNKGNIDDLFLLIYEMENEGLNPEDYHLKKLARLRNIMNANLVTDPNLRIQYDLMLSDALLRIIYHLIFGKVDPEQLHSSWNIYRDIEDTNPLHLFKSAIESPNLYNFITNLIVKDHFLVVLRDALKRYRKIALEGGWDTIAKGPTIEAGMKDERVIEVRKHLIQTKDLSIMPQDNSKYQSNDIYDTLLLEAVKRFQKRQGIFDDGKIGKKTIKALNVSVEERIRQIIVNLERGRWIYRNIEKEYILVNIAAFQARLVRNGKVIWKSRTQVGTKFRRTPVFKANLEYLEFNPTWTVPPTILEEDLLPEIKKDSTYLTKKDMVLLSPSGKIISPSTVDWHSTNVNNFPYSIRQNPGSYNALGLVKFMFPNRYLVFIHDTPSKTLFEKEKRTFSSGCIRIEQPIKLAELVLNDTIKWNRKRIQEVISTKKTKVVHLSKSIPVLLIYTTAFPSNEKDTIISFRDDIYQRDEIIFKHLNSPFKKRKRHLLP